MEETTRPLDEATRAREGRTIPPDLSTRSVGIRYGLIMGVISILLFVLFNVAGLDMNSKLRWISFPVYVVIMVLAHKYYKDQGDGFMSYGQGMGIILWMGIISSLIGSVFTWLYVKFIDTTMIETMLQQQLEEFERQGMSDDQIANAMKFTEMFMTPEAMLLMGIIGGIISSLIIGLIVTIFTQKKNPQPTF